MSETKAVSIVIGEELPLIREALAHLCCALTDCEVVAKCGDGVGAYEAIRTLKPDLALLDLALPDLDTLEIVRRVRVSLARTRVLVMSTRRDRKTVIEVLRSGGAGYVLKSGPPEQLGDALRQVGRGGVYVSPLLDIGKIFGSNFRRPGQDPMDSLSAREYQVFNLLVEGVRPKEIANRLQLSPKTVDTYRASLMRKLDIHDVAGLVKFAIHRDFAPPA